MAQSWLSRSHVCSSEASFYFCYRRRHTMLTYIHSGTIVKPAVCPNPPRKTLTIRTINLIDTAPAHAARRMSYQHSTDNRCLLDITETQLLLLAEGCETHLQSLKLLLLLQGHSAQDWKLLVWRLVSLRNDLLDSNPPENCQCC